MSGQGPQWWGMGRDLMQHEPVFREVIETCDAALAPWASFSLLEELSRSEETSQMHRTEIAQPAIFAMQVALAELWKSWGVEPAAIVGHSVGEIAAACVAGIFSLEEAARIIALRARLMESVRAGKERCSPWDCRKRKLVALIARHDRTVTISALNGPRSHHSLRPARFARSDGRRTRAQGVFARLVRVDHPFHHPLMHPASEALETELADLKPQPGHIPFFSTVTGRTLRRRILRRRPLGSRHPRSRCVCLGGQCAGGFRRGRVAGIQRASRAGSLDSGMPHDARHARLR